MRAVLEQINTHGTDSFIARRITRRGFRFCGICIRKWNSPSFCGGKGGVSSAIPLLRLAPGDMVLLGGNLPHTWSSEPRRGEAVMRHEAVVVQFTEQALGAGLFELPEMRLVRRLLDDAARGVAFAGRARAAAARRMAVLPKAAGPRRLLLLLEILVALAGAGPADRALLATPGFATEVDLPGQRRIADVCRWINEHFDEPLTLPAAAAKAHLSVSAFSRFFKTATARTFIEYVNEVRIGHACRLLLDTDGDVAGIAYAAGFSNLSHFNRRFLQLKNLSPRAFRRQYAAESPRTEERPASGEKAG